MLAKGQRVDTPYGTASVVGFEVFNKQGTSDPLASEDLQPTSRICVELDNKQAWGNGAWGNPYIYRSEIKELP